MENRKDQIFIIAKLDTPCTLDTKVMHVPSAEPLNMARALIASLGSEHNHVYVGMLGLENSRELHDYGTIEVLPYFGDMTKLKEYNNQGVHLLIWQGRHIIDVDLPTEPDDEPVMPTLSKPKVHSYFEKISFLKSWQVQMYNLVSSIYCQNMRKYAIITDIRLPLMELHAIDPVIVPEPLPADIHLLTQAYHHDKYLHYHNKFGHGIPFPECEIEPYIYKFQTSQYIPFHALPFYSHLDIYDSIKRQSKVKNRLTNCICQIQSIKYMDDFRIKQLQDLIDQCDGNVTLMGRFGDDEQGLLVAKFPKWHKQLKENLVGDKREAVPFYEAAKQLAEYAKSLVITDGRYARFGLIPNRLCEAIAMRCEPVIASRVLDHCDPEIKKQVDDMLEKLNDMPVEKPSKLDEAKSSKETKRANIDLSVYDALIGYIDEDLTDTLKEAFVKL